MPTIAPAGLVAGAARIPLPFGLFSAFPLRSPEADRWESGVAWETITCGPAGGIGTPDCDDQTPTIGLPKELDRNSGDGGEASPFIVYGHWTCSPVGFTPERAQDLATTHLVTTEQTAVETALWTGNLGNVPNLAGANGYPEPTILAGGTGMSIVDALAMLEDFVAGEYGSQGVIHMTRGLALTAAAAHLVEAVGNGTRLQTALGTPVVAGGGYPGTGPTGAAPGAGESWVYVSPPLFGYRSEIITSSARPGDLFDRGNNELTAIAERRYLLGFDPCGVGAVLVDTAI